MSVLFSPLHLGPVTVRNRLWVAPMCQYSAQDGMPNDWHLVHLAQFASGGAGLVVAEATAVTPEGRISPEDTGLWNDDQAQAWARIVEAIHERGAAAGIQLAHAGRKASTYSGLGDTHGSLPADEGGWQTLAPSAIAYDGYAAPRALTAAEIPVLVADFAAAARRAVSAGFDVIEIHAAHGYLLHEFLSPLSNTRTDAYGGSLENRARLLLEILDAVREVITDRALFVRFSASDWAPGGLEATDVAQLALWAQEHGAQLADISSGGLVAEQRIPVGPGYQVPLARVVRTAGVPVAAVGLITSGAQAESILVDGAADAIMAGREWLRDPHFGLRAASELGEDEAIWPAQYRRARR